MFDKSIDKPFLNNSFDYDVETGKMKLALARMTDEDMQSIFDKAFASFTQKI